MIQKIISPGTVGKINSGETNVAPAPDVRYCLYARKSTEQDEKQALSIDSQIKEMLELAERDKLEVVDIRREAHSAKSSGERPVYNQLLADLRAGTFDGILTWAPDRLSRNAGDLGALVDMMDQKILLEIRTFGQHFTNSPNEKFLLMILCSQAKLENDNKGINVKRGLRAKVEMGLWPCTAPTGYLNEKNMDKKGHVLVDAVRAPAVKQMFEKVAYEGWSGRKVYKWLRDDVKFTTKNGKRLTLSNVYITLKNTFYYGVFEYPRKSGNWYTGKHTPIITKELYEKAQQQIALQSHVQQAENKEFAFTKILKCGLCGSGITADEKFKRQQNGNVHRYVYYGCTKSKNVDCRSGYIREESLIEQLFGIMDTIDLNRIGIKHRIEKEVERYNKFRMGVLGSKTEEHPKIKEIDVRNYAKYILRDGTIPEKRELLTCLQSKLALRNKILYLER